MYIGDDALSMPPVWESENGVAASEVRADVKRYVDNLVRSGC